MEIFIGSSSEAAKFMEDIAVKLESLGHKPLLWSDVGKGIFPANSNTIDALIAITERVDAAVFILAQMIKPGMINLQLVIKKRLGTMSYWNMVYL